MLKHVKDSRMRISRAQLIDLLEFANSYCICTYCVCAVLWTWSHLWPAAIEMCLFNRQIEFMASLSTTRLPLRFQEEEYDPCIFTAGAWSPLSLSLSLFRFRRSLLLPAILHRPQQLSLFSLHANPSGLVSYPLHSTSSLLLSLSSHLVPLFQSFRSSFKPGPRGQEFGLVFQTSLLALLW